MKSLHARNEELADGFVQLKVLNSIPGSDITSFKEKLSEYGYTHLKPLSIDILQINVGYMCNQTCSHCHVDAGPDRKEIMTRETMLECLKAVEENNIKTVDLTGGAPEMNPDFRWFVEQLYGLGSNIIVRCNLSIIVANKKYHDLPYFFKNHKVEVVSSLPYFNKKKTDSQRGDGIFDKSIEALKMLNEVGYGKEGSGLILNLVYNPSGAFLPASEASLENDFKRQLKAHYGIEFNKLYAITNMPISRFLDFLIASGNYAAYMEKLSNAFNPAAAANVMCRNTISVGWDGKLYDCDFNQMLDLRIAKKESNHIKDFNKSKLLNRQIVVNQHCYGCTAGTGSSCGGAIV